MTCSQPWLSDGEVDEGAELNQLRLIGVQLRSVHCHQPFMCAIHLRLQPCYCFYRALVVQQLQLM